MTDSIELLSEVLDKLIETQVKNAQVTSGLKSAVEENSRHLKDVHALLEKVNGHFSNGFRHEFRDALTEATRDLKITVHEKSAEGHVEAGKILKALTDFTEAIKSPKSWIGAFLLVASIFGAVAGMVTVVLKLMGGP